MPRSTSRSTVTSPHTRTMSSFHVIRGSIRIGTLAAIPSRIASSWRSISVSLNCTASSAYLLRSWKRSGLLAPPFTTSTTLPQSDRTVQTSPVAPASSPTCTAPAAAATADSLSSGQDSAEGCVRRASTARTNRSSTVARSRTEHSSPRKRRQKSGGRSRPSGFEVRMPQPMSFPMKRNWRRCMADWHAGFGRKVSRLKPTLCREFGTGTKREVAELWRSAASSRMDSRNSPP
mmetsp:Transcript_59691/g.140572  ORF Transcript_59691/g.140572 Transcript_59691/m.140572 type:complete len:233 (-) Transcript_59691:2074-2772(-)